MNPINALLAALGVLTAAFVGLWAQVITSVRREAPSPASDARVPTPVGIGIGAVTNFFDTLGIGSFATTTPRWHSFAVVPDRIRPGTRAEADTRPPGGKAFPLTSVHPVDLSAVESRQEAAVGAG